MITDAALILDSANASIRAANTYVSTNTIDLQSSRDIATGEELNLVFTVDVAFAGGTSVQPQVITSASANLSTPSVLVSGPAVPLASLTLGATWYMPLPPRLGSVINPATNTAQRYLGVQYIGVGTFTTGSISCRLVHDVPADLSTYPSGFAVL